MTRSRGIPVVVGATVAMALGFGGLALISVSCVRSKPSRMVPYGGM